MTGTVRMITHRPNLTKYEGKLDVGLSSVSHGDVGYSMKGLLNVPIVTDRVAVRSEHHRSADRPSDWREAAIFVVRSVDTRSAASRSANERSDDSRSSVTARLSDPAATSDSPLVVARSTPGDRP